MNAKRQTRSALQASRTCYNRLCLGIITEEKDLCAHCFDYNQILVKKKQDEMGRRYQCRWPQVGVDISTTRQEEDTGRCRNRNSGSNANITGLETCDDEQEESNAKRSRPHDYKKSCAALKIKLSQAEEDAMKAQQRRDKEKNEMEAEIESLQKENTKLRDVIKKLQAEIEMKDKLSKRADEKATSDSTNERKAYAKLSEMKRSRGVEGKEAPNSVDSSKSLIKVLSDAGTPDDEIVEGFLSALCKKKDRSLLLQQFYILALGKI
jgi:hypothetical protein